MKKFLIIGICLLPLITLAEQKIDLRKESEKITHILNISIPTKIKYYGKEYKIETNRELYNNLSDTSDYTDWSIKYFNNVIDAFLITAQLGNSDLTCFKNVDNTTRKTIGETYKVLVDEGSFKMSDSAAVGIYQTMRIICDVETSITKGMDNVKQDIKQDLKNRYSNPD